MLSIRTEVFIVTWSGQQSLLHVNCQLPYKPTS